MKGHCPPGDHQTPLGIVLEKLCLQLFGDVLAALGEGHGHFGIRRPAGNDALPVLRHVEELEPGTGFTKKLRRISIPVSTDAGILPSVRILSGFFCKIGESLES